METYRLTNGNRKLRLVHSQANPAPGVNRPKRLWRGNDPAYNIYDAFEDAGITVTSDVTDAIVVACGLMLDGLDSFLENDECEHCSHAETAWEVIESVSHAAALVRPGKPRLVT